MKNRNSGLGCGCSGGGDVDLGFVAPSSVQITVPGMKYQAIAPGRQPVTPATPMSYYREGMAFGAAWTASLERNVTVPAQWHSDLERVAQQTGIPVSSVGMSWSNRDAFVSGFDMGIRVVLERRTSILSPIGRTYSAEFLLAQGRVAANNLFNQARPAVLPFVSTTGMAPSYAPGLAYVSTYDRLVQLARMTPSGLSVSGVIAPTRGGWDNSAPSAWLRFLFGRNAITPFPTPAATSLSESVLVRIRGWAQDTLNSRTLPPGSALEAYVMEIAATPWIPLV